MRRFGSIVVAVVLSASLFTVAGCQKKVEVKSGTRTVCTYGEVVSSNVKTISVPADKASSYHVRTVTVTCDRHKKLEALYAAAQEDIAKGNLEAAAKKLTQIVAVDSAFGSASKQLSDIKAGKKPTPETAPKPNASKPTTTTPKPGDDKPTGPIESMLKWTPDTLAGYTASKVAADAMSLSRQYTPAAGAKATSLVIAAEQYRDAKTASAALDAYAKRPFPKNASTVSVNGHSMYFGTDSTRYAILAFNSGAVLVQIEMTSKPGAQATLKTDLIAVAKQLP